MTKENFIKSIRDKMQITASEAERFVEVFQQTVAEILIAGDSLKLTNFCKFEVKEKPAREYRNLNTGGTVLKPAHKQAVCRMSNKLSDKL